MNLKKKEIQSQGMNQKEVKWFWFDLWEYEVKALKHRGFKYTFSLGTWASCFKLVMF